MNDVVRAPDEIESRLLPVVEELLFEHGYQGLNIRDVAKRVEMGPATIYKYFLSKEGLALRVLQDQDNEIARVVSASVPTEGSIRSRWKAFYCELMAYYDDHVVVAVIQNAAMPAGTWFLPENKWPVTALAQVIHGLIRDGRASGELDPALTDNQIMATHYMNLVREVRLWRSRDMRWKLSDRIEQFFPIVWKTISAPAPAPKGG